jgi:hypothetical protein
MTVDMDFDIPDFPVAYSDLDAWCRGNLSDNYVGMSVDYDMTFHFSTAISDSDNSALTAQVSALTESGEATKLANDADIQAAIAAALVAIPSEDWDSMIPAERKLVMGQALTDADESALLTKYPQ